MKNSEYWVKRFELLEKSANQDSRKLMGELERQIKLSENTINKDIARWYQRFADNNKIGLVDAKKLLNSGEMAELKWTVEEYIKHGTEVGLNPRYMKQLENASAKYHITRLEALKIDLQQSTEVMYQNQLDSLDGFLRGRYTESYYRTAFEVQKGFKVGFELAGVNQNQLSKVLSKPWAADGFTFSERIWNDKTKLINDLQDGLFQNISLGKPPDNLIKVIAEKHGTTKQKAGRLVMTESAFIHSSAQQELFKELGVEEYAILATLDNSTSDICQEMDTKVFRLTDYEVGVTAPPFHPWCRSITIPHFDDNITQRAARGEDGKTYYVDNMSYKEWKNKHDSGTIKLAPKEEYAINKYLKTKHSVDINRKLRNDENLEQADIDFLRIFDSTLEKLPKYIGHVNRSLDLGEEELKNFYKQFIGSKTVTFKAYTSSTTLTDYNPNESVRLVISSKSGRDLREYNALEKEIVFKRSSTFKLVDAKRINGLPTMYLEEV